MIYSLNNQKMLRYLITLLSSTLLLLTCQPTETEKADAYGNFETTTTTVSAQAIGELMIFDAEEGKKLVKGQLIALVDTTQLHLQRKLLQAQMGTISKKTRDPNPDITVLNSQKANLVREKDRLIKLIESKAATTKQLDDLEGEMAVIDQKITAARSNASTVNTGILAEKEPLKAQIALIDQQIKDCYIYNPITGIVINKLSEVSEVVNFGSPLYRIANLDILTLRAYTDATRMQNLKLNDIVEVRVDEGIDSLRSVQGIVRWISEEAEFTPKTIQTKEERIHSVYAIKIDVPNDGRLKIGMPAEVNFSTDPAKTQ